MSARRIDWERIKERLAEVERNLTSSLVFDDARKQRLLRKRAEYLAARRPDGGVALETQAFMVFLIHGERYAVGLRHLRQVVPLEGLVPVPGAPDGILGVMNLGGEVGTIWDLGRLLDLPERETRAAGHAIVLNAGVEIGLRVDFVEGRQDIDAGNVILPNGPNGALDMRFLEGLTQDRIHILDVKAILGSIHSETGRTLHRATAKREDATNG
jgi:chemotaxis signal transduction protein